MLSVDRLADYLAKGVRRSCVCRTTGVTPVTLGRPFQGSCGHDTTLSIVVPVWNEERRLPRFLERLEAEADQAVTAAGLELAQVFVVDDGSTDGTPDILGDFSGLGDQFRFIRFDRANKGKGAAVRAGMLAAKSDFALMSDVDLSTPLDELRRLTARMNGEADITIGSRGLSDSDVLVHEPWYRETAGKTFNLFIRAVTRLPWRDTQCGFKLFRLGTTRRLFELQRSDGFAFDVELLVLARRLRLVVREVPVRWINDPDTRVRFVSSSAQMALDTPSASRTCGVASASARQSSARTTAQVTAHAETAVRIGRSRRSTCSGSSPAACRWSNSR
jgi:dolichyl-phosphate beta-glucosyltransferase